MQNKIKFSVLMANYNKGKYIAKAIQSVLDQTFKEWELIIVDDCSTDNSLEVIKPFLKDKRIRLIRNIVNTGVVICQIRLINEAEAEIVGILDSDDALINTALQDVYSQYNKYPGYGFVYTQFICCDSKLNPKKKGKCDSIPPNKTNLQSDCVSHFKTFKKKEYFKTQGYDEEMWCAEDKDLIFKMEEITKLLFIDKILYKYRVLPHSLSIDPSKRRQCQALFILAKYKAYKRRLKNNIPNLSKKEMVILLLEGASIYIGVKHLGKALYFLSQAIWVDPLKFLVHLSRDLLWTRTFSRLM